MSGDVNAAAQLSPDSSTGVDKPNGSQLRRELTEVKAENKRLRRRVRELERGRAMWRARAVAYWNGRRSKRSLR